MGTRRNFRKGGGGQSQNEALYIRFIKAKETPHMEKKVAKSPYIVKMAFHKQKYVAKKALAQKRKR